MSKHTLGLVDILDYVIDAEERDFRESGEPPEHVYALAQKYRKLAEAAPELLEFVQMVARMTMGDAADDAIDRLIGRARELSAKAERK